MIILLGLVLALVLITILYMRQDQFGKAPTGRAKEVLARSAQYHNGKFKNLIHTPDLTEGYSIWSVIKAQFFTSHPRLRPSVPLPSSKVDLLSLPPEKDALVWFGHSSYFLQLDGVRILVDPVLSGKASPLPGTVTAFDGTDRYGVDDLPAIDVLLISHDHYDHLDYKTILALQPKVKQVICGLGVGSHFLHWGYDTTQVNEQDWNEHLSINSHLRIHTLPARHFSGRGFNAKNTLWASYLIEGRSMKIYAGGDSGYGPFFQEIGDRFGPIDLVILDNGQYNAAWREIHMHPEEVLAAAKDLQAKQLFPVHSSKFVLAMHPWDEPLREISRLYAAAPFNFTLFTPQIGALNNLTSDSSGFTPWWEGIH